jgi:phosphatidylglycerophosphatase A
MVARGQKVVRAVVLAFASGGFFSYIPVWLLPNRRNSGSGLVGSFWGVLLLSRFPLGPIRQSFVWLAAFLISVAISDAAEEYLGVKDDPRIVIDEFIGYWTAMLFLPRTLSAVALAFVLFRLFDTWKPIGIRQVGNLPGGWGVVLDDVAAGLAANVFLRCLAFIHPL